MEFKQVTALPPAGGTKKKRRAYVPQDKQARFIKNWKESGLTQTDFCKRQNIHLKTFSRWLGKSSISATRTTLDDVKPKPQNSASCQSQQDLRVEVHLANGVRISCAGMLPAPFILSIIKEVGTCRSN